MQKVKMRKDYREYNRGEIYEVPNNEAHALNEAGLAKVVRSEKKEVSNRKDKMMTSNKKESTKYFRCEYCGKSFETKRGLSVHLNYCDEKKDKEVTAEDSGKKYVTK
jgi:hypothetical protein